jgi:ATP-dependent Clp protease ATP-binding subunit ClpC
MYERFTDGARNALSSANREAKRWNHTNIEPEHVLLALLDELGWGVAQLQEITGGSERIREEVEKDLQFGSQAIHKRHLQPMPTVKQAIEIAVKEAQSLQQAYVGTDHLLLGILRRPTERLATALTTLGVDCDALANEIQMNLRHS